MKNGSCSYVILNHFGGLPSHWPFDRELGQPSCKWTTGGNLLHNPIGSMGLTGIYTLTFWTLEISRVRVQTPGLPVTWGKIPGFSDKSRVCRKNLGFSLLCRNFQFFLGWGGRCLPIRRIYWLFTYLRGRIYPFRMAICDSESPWVIP